MQFLQDEFVNISQSDAFSFIPKKYLAEALKSDFLQVFDILSINEVKIIFSLISTLPPCTTACEVGTGVGKGVLYKVSYGVAPP